MTVETENRAAEPEEEIDELRAAAAALGGGRFDLLDDRTASSAFRRFFWEEVVKLESAARTTQLQRLEAEGVSLPNPDLMTDEEVSSKLREVVETLARLQVYLSSTDHLSDRALYSRLRSRSLRSPAYPEVPETATVIDLLASGTEQDMMDYLSYYADDLARQMWSHQWPERSLPEKRERPFDRDRTLPKASFMTWASHPDGFR